MAASRMMVADAAADALLANLRTHHLSKENLSMLHFLYQKNLERALSILDQEGVKRVVGEHSRRTVYLVHGETKKSDEHLCFPKHFCSCYSFFYDVVVRKQQLSCKHQLAARLAEALGICKEETVSDEELAILLLEKRSKHPKKNHLVQFVLEKSSSFQQN